MQKEEFPLPAHKQSDHQTIKQTKHAMRDWQQHFKHYVFFVLQCRNDLNRTTVKLQCQQYNVPPIAHTVMCDDDHRDKSHQQACPGVASTPGVSSRGHGSRPPPQQEQRQQLMYKKKRLLVLRKRNPPSCTRRQGLFRMEERQAE